MQIRQILTAIIVFTALLSVGITATVFVVRDQASSEFRLVNDKQIFQSRMDQVLELVDAQLIEFGPEGDRSSFFNETNDKPLDYTRNTANYFNNVELTAEVRNPIHKNIIENQPNLNRKYLIPFYAQALSKSELTFYSLIDGGDFRTLNCRADPRAKPRFAQRGHIQEGLAQIAVGREPITLPLVTSNLSRLLPQQKTCKAGQGL